MNIRTLRNQLITNEMFYSKKLDTDGVYGPKSNKFFKFDDILPFPAQCAHRLTALGVEIPAQGKISTFGGPGDDGDNLNGLAYIPNSFSGVFEFDAIAKLFNYTALVNSLYGDWLTRESDGRRCGLSGYLNPSQFYCALPIKTPKSFYPFLLTVTITNVKTRAKWYQVPIIDYGPAAWTKRIMDVSPGVATMLDLVTDDEVLVEFDF
jgi:hypothetical protein